MSKMGKDIFFGAPCKRLRAFTSDRTAGDPVHKFDLVVKGRFRTSGCIFRNILLSGQIEKQTIDRFHIHTFFEEVKDTFSYISNILCAQRSFLHRTAKNICRTKKGNHRAGGSPDVWAVY